MELALQQLQVDDVQTLLRIHKDLLISTAISLIDVKHFKHKF